MTFPVGDGRTVSLNVGGIVGRSLPGRGGEAVLVGWKDASAAFGVVGADAFAIRLAPRSTAADRSAVEALARADGLVPTAVSTADGAIGDALGRVFTVFDALAAVAIVIGGLGIANTLAMGVLERGREVSVLRAAGMTRRQVWRTVVVEAGLLGLVGAMLGIVGGIVVGSLVRAPGSADAPPLALPWPSLAVAFVLGLGVSLLAATYPAWLAARVPVVRAVRAE